MKSFCVYTPLSPNGYKSAAFYHFLFHNKATVPLVVFGLFSAGTMIALWHLGVLLNLFLYLCAWALIGSILTSAVLFYLRLNKVIAQNSQLFDTQLSLTFDDQGFVLHSEKGDLSFNKNQIARCANTKKYLHIFLKGSQAEVTIVKSALSPQSAYSLMDWVRLLPKK